MANYGRTMIGATVILVFTASCGNSVDDPSPMDQDVDPRATSGHGASLVVATYQPTGVGSDGAPLQGTIVVAESGCLEVKAADGRTHLPVFPDPDVTVNGDTLKYLESTYSVGSEISLGGGYTEWRAGVTTRPECRSESVFVVGYNPSR